MASVYLRIRQIKPEIWRNRTLAELGAEVRLTYIGLWMVADDHGILSWKPDQIAALLFMYEPWKKREAKLQRIFDVLAAAPPGIHGPMISMLSCGYHAQIPSLPYHQNVATTRRSSQHLREHNEQCTSNGAPPLPIADASYTHGAHMSGNGNGNGNGNGGRNASALQGPDGLWHTGQHPDCGTCATYRDNATKRKRR